MVDKNNRGSTLVYVIVIIMVISITIAAALTISYAYYQRSITENSRRQAYLGAKGLLTDITENIYEGNSTYVDLIPDGLVQTSSTLDIRDFPLELGTVETAGMSISERTENEIQKYVLTIYVSVTSGTQTIVLNSDLIRNKVPVKNEKWQFLKYYEGNIPVSYNIRIANELISSLATIRDHTNQILSATDASQKKLLKQNFLEYLYEHGGKDFGIKDTNLLSNDYLRQFVFHTIQKDDNGSAPALDMNELTLPKGVKLNQLYLHVMFGYQAATPRMFIYATPTKDVSKPDWLPTLIFLPSTGHWYYNKFPYMAGLNATSEANAAAIYQSILDLCTPDHIVQ